ncbi:MAG: hypothetical protein Q9162_007381 [Coniocarpon cinnabarinum]
MSSIRYAATTLAVSALAAAQCSVQGTTTVGAEATQLGSCPTFSGNIAIATDAPGTVDFGMLGAIDGDLIANNAQNVATLTANNVANITGTFRMINMTSLFTMNMMGLRGVGQGNRGGIAWDTLPILQSLSFGPGLDSAASISIQNTQIQDLSAVNVKQAAQIQVSNNQALSALNWATTNCTNLTINGNGYSSDGANITLNSLEGADSISVRNASSLSLPALEEVTGLFAVESGGLQSLMLPNMTRVGGISVSNSPELTNVSMPKLQSCTGDALKLINNDQLSGDLIFPALTQVRGDLNITGGFSSVQMPIINTIRGTSYLWSTQDISSTCKQFGPKGTYAGSKIQGGVTCHSNSQSASAGGGGGSTGTSGGSSSSSSAAAIPGFIAQPASLFGATGLLAAMLGLM